MSAQGNTYSANPWIRRGVSTRSELHKIKKQAGDDSRDAAGGVGKRE